MTTHPQSPWNVRDGLRTGGRSRRPQEFRNDRSSFPAMHDQDTLWRQQVVWMSMSETQWHENRNSEVKRFLKLSMSRHREPRNERHRCSGTERLDRHHWKLMMAEHTSRIGLGVMLASLAVGVDCRYLWSPSAENVGDIVEAEDDDGDPPVLCGRNSCDGWIFSHLLLRLAILETVADGPCELIQE